MNLTKRLESLRGVDTEAAGSSRDPPAGLGPAAPQLQSTSPPNADDPKAHGADANDALNAIKDRAGAALYERMGSRITDAVPGRVGAAKLCQRRAPGHRGRRRNSADRAGTAPACPGNHRRRAGTRTAAEVPE